MPRRIGVIVFGLIAVSSLFFVRVARADPHATFYTVVGQQQLFFNTLAALNQAEYVETVDLRQQLVQSRAEAGQRAEEAPVVTATRSNLANLVTRSITLEGDDLYTSFLNYQFARESARRNATSEFIALACERAFGRVGCDPDPDRWQLNDAFVDDPVAYADLPYEEGVLGVLESGSFDDQEKRKKRLDTADPDNERKRLIPRAFSDAVAKLRDSTGAGVNTGPGNNEKFAHFEDVLNKVRLAFRPFDDIPVDVYDRINYVDLTTGEIELRYQIDPSLEGFVDNPSVGDSLSPEQYRHEYLRAISDLARLPAAIQAEAQRGSDYIRAYQAIEEQAGAVADITLEPKITSDNGLDQIGELRPKIKTPAHAKLALTHAAADTIGDIDQNLLFAVPEQEKVPGTEELVGPRGSGQVLGLLDNPDDFSSFFDTANNVSRAADTAAVAPHREEALFNALRAFSGDTFRRSDPGAATCGYCVNLSAIVPGAAPNSGG